MRARCTGRAHRWIHLATAHARATNEMGTPSTFACALTLNDSHGGNFSLELSLVAAFPSRPRALRGASATIAATIADRFCIGAAANRCHHSDVDLRNGGRA